MQGAAPPSPGSGPVLDLDAYFERIGYQGARAPTLDVLHALTMAHTQAIPFENLDVLLGCPIDIDTTSIFRKLVTAGRGGYCFEQNGLFLYVLQALGFEAKPLSARVRLERPRDVIPPRTHVFLQVDIGGEAWLTDVGVGGASLTSAIRMDHEGPQQTAHDVRRIVHENGAWFHQVRYGETWHDVYEFTGEAMPFIDREVANWFTSTHPRSHFRDRLMVARALPDGRRISVSKGEFTLRERDGSATVKRLTTEDELIHVLSASFGISLAPGTHMPGALAQTPT